MLGSLSLSPLYTIVVYSPNTKSDLSDRTQEAPSFVPAHSCVQGAETRPTLTRCSVLPLSLSPIHAIAIYDTCTIADSLTKCKHHFPVELLDTTHTEKAQFDIVHGSPSLSRFSVHSVYVYTITKCRPLSLPYCFYTELI